jgi:hypothetical protein
MGNDQWLPRTAPPEAYGRITNPERFSVLHDVASKLLRELTRDFDVERPEGYAVDPQLEGRCTLAHPTETLTPRDRAAAPVVVAFSAFPGLRVRFGRWCTMAFPGCGCDACNERAEDEVARLTSMIDNLVEGRFSEAIEVGGTSSWTEWTFWSADRREHSTSLMDREEAQQLLAASGRSSLAWKPWPRRGNAEST